MVVGAEGKVGRVAQVDRVPELVDRDTLPM